jgi:uncharacterized Zn-finger protein
MLQNAMRMDLDADFVVIHDSQPRPLIAHERRACSWAWRCHVDCRIPIPRFGIICAHSLSNTTWSFYRCLLRDSRRNHRLNIFFDRVNRSQVVLDSGVMLARIIVLTKLFYLNKGT